MMTGIQQDYVGTTEEWEDENPLLPEGVRGIELTEDGRRYYKVGDGVSLWNDLPYFDKFMVKGLAEELASIDSDRVPGNEMPEMDGTGSAGDPENWNYSRSDHQHPSDTSRVALASDETQVIDSDVALAKGKKLLGLRKDNTQANLVSVADQGTHERIEVGTKSDPMCLNHSARAADGTVVGAHIIVEYKDDDGDPQTDAVAYESEIQALKKDMDAWIGRGGFLDEHDFGIAAPTQEALTEYALSQIPSISDPTDIWNGTKVKNIYDGHTWILTNTKNTDPPVFEWTDQGTIDLAAFTNTAGGYIKGDDTRDGYVNAQSDYTGKVNGWDNLPRKIDYTFNEQDTGLKWVDEDVVYQRTFNGLVIGNINGLEPAQTKAFPLINIISGLNDIVTSSLRTRIDGVSDDNLIGTISTYNNGNDINSLIFTSIDFSGAKKILIKNNATYVLSNTGLNVRLFGTIRYTKV
jgi:hypothetical protein